MMSTRRSIYKFRLRIKLFLCREKKDIEPPVFIYEMDRDKKSK
jgi:hypothetical protein